LRTATLLTILWLSAAGSAAEWQLAPRLMSGQELVYRGAVKEENFGRGVQFTRHCKLELRSLVLEMKGQDAEVAFLTSVQPHQPAAHGGEMPSPTVRLELALVNGQGRLSLPNGSLPLLPIDGPNTWETGFLHELPKQPVAAKQTWTSNYAGHPPCTYRVVGPEPIGATTCLRIEMEQRSEHWATGRGDQPSWLRTETIWLNTRLGVAERVVRKLYRRDPAQLHTTYVQTLELELESTPRRYEGALFEDRKREILATQQFHEQVKHMLADARRPPPQAFEAVAAKIDQFLKKHQPTPYREALQRVRALTVAAGKGQVPPGLEDLAPRSALALGKPAPEFVIEDLLTRSDVTLRGLRGKMTLLLFVHPGSLVASDVLRQAQAWEEQFGPDKLTLVCFSMSDDPVLVRQLAQRRDWKGPMLSGRALRISYGVDATPRIVVLDQDGVVRAAQTGWGPEIPRLVEAELRKMAGERRPEKPAAIPGTP